MPIIIGISGMPGCGKTTTARILKELGYRIVYFGEITQEELKKRSLPINETNEKLIRNQLREELGQGAYAILWIDKLKDLIKKEKIAIDGVYSWEEVKILKKDFKDSFLVLSVITNPKIRYQRLSNRKERPLSIKEAQSRDYDEIENLNKGGPIAMADINIINEDTFESLKNNIEAEEKKWIKDLPGMPIS